MIYYGKDGIFNKRYLIIWLSIKTKMNFAHSSRHTQTLIWDGYWIPIYNESTIKPLGKKTEGYLLASGYINISPRFISICLTCNTGLGESGVHLGISFSTGERKGPVCSSGLPCARWCDQSENPPLILLLWSSPSFSLWSWPLDFPKSAF